MGQRRKIQKSIELWKQAAGAAMGGPFSLTFEVPPDPGRVSAESRRPTQTLMLAIRE